MENKEITVNKILEICNGKLFAGNKEMAVDSFSNDTRNINKGDIYLAIKGEKINGNYFLEDAFNKGAIGAIIDEDVDEEFIKKYNDKVIIKVENTVNAMQKLAEYKRSLYNIPVIAVTGSVRKNKYKRCYCKCCS